MKQVFLLLIGLSVVNMALSYNVTKESYDHESENVYVIDYPELNSDWEVCFEAASTIGNTRGYKVFSDRSDDVDYTLWIDRKRRVSDSDMIRILIVGCNPSDDD